MFHEAVAEIISFLRRNDLPERHLNFFRVLDPVHETNPVCQADAVGIGDDRRFSEDITHDEVRALSSDAREF